MCDMLAFIVDCLFPQFGHDHEKLIKTAAPPQTRPALFTSFVAELTNPAVQAAFDASHDLTSALPHLSPSRRPMVLKTTDAGETIPLDDRPWEMFEQLAPASRKLRHVDMFLSSRPIRDTASIPVTLFNPQLKRDPLPAQSESDEECEQFRAERSLGDGLAGEPLAAKQAATLLYAVPNSPTAAAEKGVPAVSPANTQKTESAGAQSPINPIPTMTPANRPRRASARTLKTGGSTKDAIDLEDSSSESDNDIVEQAPPPKRARVGSKSTGTGGGATAGPSAARPAVGGKAPANRTTGGKGVARKGTGGKNVGRKAPGGKAPKKR